MKTTKNKARNKRIARKRALRTKHRLQDECATRDTMSAAQRNWGQGVGR